MNVCKNEKTNYFILLHRNCSECNRYAAEELKRFLAEATLATFEITDEGGSGNRFISLGKTELFERSIDKEAPALGTDGYIIKEVNGNLFIDGNTDRAVLFGVYGFLEKFLGIRFIAADTTYVKRIYSLDIPDGLDLVEIPDFPMRGYLEASMYDEDGKTQPLCDYDFALRKKSNQQFLFPDEKHGGRCAYWGRGECHNFHLYVSPEIYNNPEKADTYHPEFFWIDKTKENVEGGLVVLDENDLTICLTNGITDDGKLDENMDISVASVAIEELKKDIISHPDIVFFNFDQEDGHTKCECERCKKFADKYMRSGVLIRFCNVVAREIQKWADETLNGRKVYIVTFAYSYALDAPVKDENGKMMPIDESVVPCDNLIIRLAVGRNCYYSYFDDRQLPRSRKALEEWGIVGKRFFCWIYDAMFDRFLYFVPSLHTIDDNVDGFKKLGIEYLMVQGGHNVGGLWQSSMHSYIYLAKMWDTSLKTSDLAEEFLHHYFGEIGSLCVNKVIKLFYGLYDKVVQEDGVAIYSMGGMEKKGSFPKKLLDEVIRLVTEARRETMSQNNEKGRLLFDKHLAQVQLNAVYPLCEQFFFYFPKKDRSEYFEFAKEWVELCEYAGVTMYSEGTTVQSFVDENYIFPQFFD